MSKTYFFDVSDILAYVRTETSVSGIQRVSLAVITRMVERYGAARVKIAYWSDEGDYEALGADVLLQMGDFDADRLGHLFFGEKSRPAQAIAPSLERYRTRPLKYAFHNALRHVHAALGNEKHFRRKGTTLADWRAFRTQQAPQTTQTPPPPPRPKTTPVRDLAKPGDRVIVMGAVWGQDALAKALEHLSATQGVNVTILVHDLIPILAPEHMHGGYSHSFETWLGGSAAYCSSYFANSKYTAKDLKEFLDNKGTPRPIHVVPLAQSFEPTPLTSGNSLSKQVNDVLKTPYVLVVGTMDSRKNLTRLAQAWEKMAQNGTQDLPRLVLAGKENWLNSDFTDWMEDTNHLNGLIELVIRPSDAELTALYAGCLFTAMVSLYEGWGLPIGEGLSMGKTGVVSHHSSMPEVGGDMVEYCDPYDLNSITTACQNLISNPTYRKTLEQKISQTNLRSWEDVTADFIAALEAEMAPVNAGFSASSPQ